MQEKISQEASEQGQDLVEYKGVIMVRQRAVNLNYLKQKASEKAQLWVALVALLVLILI